MLKVLAAAVLMVGSLVGCAEAPTADEETSGSSSAIVGTPSDAITAAQFLSPGKRASEIDYVERHYGAAKVTDFSKPVTMPESLGKRMEALGSTVVYVWKVPATSVWQTVSGGHDTEARFEPASQFYVVEVSSTGKAKYLYFFMNDGQEVGNCAVRTPESDLSGCATNINDPVRTDS